MSLWLRESPPLQFSPVEGEKDFEVWEMQLQGCSLFTLQI